MSRQHTSNDSVARPRFGSALRMLAGLGLAIATTASLGCGGEDEVSGPMEIWNVEPRIGGTGGEQAVRITGRNFRQDIGYTVYFGANRASSVMIPDSSTLVVVSPQHEAGPVDVVIVSEAGSAFRVQQGYLFSDQALGEVAPEASAGPRDRAPAPAPAD